MRDLKTAVFLVDWVGCRNSFWQFVFNFGVEDLDGKRKCKSSFQKKKDDAIEWISNYWKFRFTRSYKLGI